ncbi:Rieske (2Fe-2S) protein [Geovibrio thiophilus]|uniref:Rieske (2Fe-2S) protein n=1 Tax=Geovibrio thiophilus TaxID=139438 RepID=A0A3R5UYE8_9BACT|nr:Rieske (2Fe-2S) protein [Geovibrio thiophilus]QAR33541.1 Rieske (2Fe-2S) protein [Geovibrio thiophilus]
MDFIKAAKTEDFTGTSWKAVKILAKNIGIFKRDDGSFYAMEISCKHQQANLLTNGLPKSGSVIKCHRHGWEYDLSTGRCLTHPDGYSDLRFYELKVENGAIFISAAPLPKD